MDHLGRIDNPLFVIQGFYTSIGCIIIIDGVMIRMGCPISPISMNVLSMELHYSFSIVVDFKIHCISSFLHSVTEVIADVSYMYYCIFSVYFRKVI